MKLQSLYLPDTVLQFYTDMDYLNISVQPQFQFARKRVMQTEPFTFKNKYSYNKKQRGALISQIYFGIELYMFRTGLLSIIRSLVLYT